MAFSGKFALGNKRIETLMSKQNIMTQEVWKLNIPEVPIASLAVSPLRGAAAAAALRGRQLLVLEPRQVGGGRAGRRLKHDAGLRNIAAVG